MLHRAIDLIRYASDASPYRRFPAAVVMAHDAADVGKVLAYARRTGMPVNFRGGGTSLNGQAQTDGIMIDVRRWFSGVKDRGRRRARAAEGRNAARAWPTGCSSATASSSVPTRRAKTSRRSAA